MSKLTVKEVSAEIEKRLTNEYGVTAEAATDEQFYRASASFITDIISQVKTEFNEKCAAARIKRVNYLSMEFLPGRSLRNSLFNLGLTEVFEEALSSLGVKLSSLCELEPDAALGNGGLGRLAACFLDTMASKGYLATGYSILYEFGIFRQKLEDGWQTELPDSWLPGGAVWLTPRPDEKTEVHFGGRVDDYWDSDGYHRVNHTGYYTVNAVPVDLMMAGYGGKGAAVLRLWKAQAADFDMLKFSSGDFYTAIRESTAAEVISKALYPYDNNAEGKSLRLRQQYFLVSASVQDIIRKHTSEGYSISRLPEQNAIHINDTHPALAVPELMRVLMDECGYGWDTAWDITRRTVSYTNHTVMNEALERWPESLFAEKIPRIRQIVAEIDRRYRAELAAEGAGSDMIERMAVIGGGQIRMANLCCAASHCVNGVSKLHTGILRDRLFADLNALHPEKLRNVTNGITYRRWLCQADPGLSSLISELIGDGFRTDAGRLEGLRAFAGDAGVLERLGRIKRENKVSFSNFASAAGAAPLDPDSIFDVQIKRLHEYKRQHLNALHILSRYLYLKDHPGEDCRPQTFIFGAKAAPGYFMAKQIISLVCAISKLIDSDPAVRGRLRVLFVEDYRVTAAEALMPAAEISEQISLAGTEASGTGNMKLMLNGAVTLGTMDGANIEICEAVGPENMIIFGMNAREAELRRPGYRPQQLLGEDPELAGLVKMLRTGICGKRFTEIADSLERADHYMALADFASYKDAQARMRAAYADRTRFLRMSLLNTAASGRFSSDRAVREYAENIWNAEPLKEN